jgi:hypothetical protein
MFYQIGPDAKHFIENRSGRGTEAMAGRDILGNAHGSQGGNSLQ